MAFVSLVPVFKDELGPERNVALSLGVGSDDDDDDYDDPCPVIVRAC